MKKLVWGGVHLTFPRFYLIDKISDEKDSICFSFLLFQLLCR